jgi:hypothetical protein
MPRPKGPGAIKLLDPAKQDAVAMRNLLWRGKHDNPQEALRKLRAQEIRLMGSLRDLHARKEFGISAAETELRDVRKQIKEAVKQINRADRRKPVFPWQAKATWLIEVHKYLHSDGDCVTSTQGATITTDELQKQLGAEGFKVGARELRRFMRQCGVAGKQGKRTDFTSPSKPQFASLSSAVLEKPESNCELIEQRRAEQAALTPAQRTERIHKRDAVARAYEHYCDTPEGRAEQDHKTRLASFYARHPEYKDS